MHQRLEEGDLRVVFEHRDNALPGVHAPGVKVHITAPQITHLR